MNFEIPFLKNKDKLETNNQNEVEKNNNSILTLEDEEREKGLDEKTQSTVVDIKELVKNENLIRLTPEKRKIVLDKVKALMLVLVALGVYVASKDLDAMEAVSDTVGPSKEAMIGFAGTLTALVGAIGYGFRNAYNKFKLDEQRQNPQPEKI